MSGFPVWCELACDRCSKANFGRWSVGTIPRREMKHDAKLKGWTFGEMILCRDCSVTHVEQNETKTRTAAQTVNSTVNSENALDDESEKT